MVKVVIPGRFPGINDYVNACRRNQYAGAQAIKSSEKVIREALEKQIRDLLIPPVTIVYTFYEPNKRRDKDNISGFFHKVFQDSLVKSGLLPDDSWDFISGFHDYFEVDRGEPRIEIKILEKGD